MEVPHLNAAVPRPGGAAAALSPVQRSKRVWEEFPASICKTSLSALNRASAKMPTKDRQALRGPSGDAAVIVGRRGGCPVIGHHGGVPPWGCPTMGVMSLHGGATEPGRDGTTGEMRDEGDSRGDGVRRLRPGRVSAPPSEPLPWGRIGWSLGFFLYFFFFLAAATAFCKNHAGSCSVPPPSLLAAPAYLQAVSSAGPGPRGPPRPSATGITPSPSPFSLSHAGTGMPNHWDDDMAANGFAPRPAWDELPSDGRGVTGPPSPPRAPRPRRLPSSPPTRRRQKQMWPYIKAD